MDEKFKRRFTSFCNSLDALAEAKQRDLSDSFVLSGTSAKFSITFDLAWKVMKDILVQHYAITGFVAGSPREVLREAFKANLISDDAWMEMLKVRNELTHDLATITLSTQRNTSAKFHSHPSGTRNEITRSDIGITINTFFFTQFPSSDDIINAGSITNYVFGRADGMVYIYNAQGVQAVINYKNFINFDK